MTRYAFLGDVDSRVDDNAGNPAANRRVRFYADAAKVTEYTDLASDASGTGSPLTVLSNAYGYAPMVYLPDGVDGTDAHPVYVGAVDSAGNPPSYVARVYSHQAGGGGGAVASVFGRSGAVVAQSGDYTAAQVGAVPTARQVAGHALSADVTLVKADVGLGNVDDTSDANKPVSTAQAAADAAVLSTAEGYTDTKVTALVNGAPGILDTLGEIAAALQSDESAAAALTTTVAGKENVVVHGAVAATVRPAATVVHWIGSVQPTNAATNDEWTDSANKAVKRYNGASWDLIGTGASVPDASASVKGLVQLAGDLGGTAASPTVPGLAGKAATSHTHAEADVTSLATDLAARLAIQETVNAQAAVTGAYTIPDVTTATLHRLVLTGAATFTFPTAAAGKSFALLLVQDATGSRTVTWPGTVKWAGGTAPTLTTTASKADEVSFRCYDGTNWVGTVSANI